MHEDIKQNVLTYEHNLLGINENDIPNNNTNTNNIAVKDEVINNNISINRSDTQDDKHDDHSHTQIQHDHTDSN